ncbi:MAG TPA: ribonuclease HII [Patescibacteria group bacterium]|nr:ribonuclease HII [Patescibacteria group bacterium]
MIVGIDEVGRGCWAGPLVAGAVLLGEPIAGPNDSKKLNKKQRIRLDAEVRVAALGFGLGWVTPEEVDTLGLTAAVRLAMQRALEQIRAPYRQIIVDGNHNFLADNPLASAVIAADASVPAVSAASIIAKVARDNYMAQQAFKFPGYGFEKHVGYGTAAHSLALKTLGVCELHRRSYKPIQAYIV